MSDSEGDTNAEYHPPPPPNVKKVVKPKKAKPKKDEKRKPIVEYVSDITEWERLLRDVPLESGHIRIYIGKKVKTRFD